MAARRRKKATRRRRKSFSVTNAIFSIGYGSILTEGFFKTNLLEFLLGDLNLGFASGGGISLKEIMGRPELLEVAVKQGTAALPEMIFKSFGLAVTERVFKKVMAMPLRRVNSGIVTPLLGKGIRV